MKILIPQGIGDSIWALHKIQDLARKKGDGRVEAYVACCDLHNKVEARALEFVKRFAFVEHAEMKWVWREGAHGCVLQPGTPADEQGYYRYLPDGEGVVEGVDYVMMPNAALERGIRLENWLPEIEVNWNVMNDFRFTQEETALGEQFRGRGEFVAFFLGNEANNSYGGHNRGGIWTPADWIQLAQNIQERFGVRIVVVGAEYDRNYFDKHLRPFVTWEDYIGKWGIGETYAVLRQARFIISYQSGIGIVSNYFGVPVGIFWRAKGDSISSDYYLSFEEGMASAWANPAMIADGKHLPLIYGRHGVDYIMNEIVNRKW